MPLGLGSQRPYLATQAKGQWPKLGARTNLPYLIFKKLILIEFILYFKLKYLDYIYI